MDLGCIADVLERGSADDWRELARRTREDQSGASAKAVGRILFATEFYGARTLWLDYLDRHGHWQKYEALYLECLHARRSGQEPGRENAKSLHDEPSCGMLPNGVYFKRKGLRT